MLFLRSLLSTAFRALFLSRGSQRVCVGGGGHMGWGAHIFQKQWNELRHEGSNRGLLIMAL